MKQTTLIMFFFFSITTFAFGQKNDTLNRLNSKGKKNGVWIQYLDSLIYPTDSANSYFYGYELYDNGKSVFSFSNRNKCWRKYRLVYNGTLPKKGKPVPVDGTFKWYFAEIRVEAEETYKNGKPFYWNSYSYSQRDSINSNFNEVLYFDKLYNNIPGTFYYEEWHRGKVDRKEWFRKGKKGWRAYKIEEK